MARYKVMHDRGAREYTVVLDSGESVVEVLLEFARAHELPSASFTATGGFSGCTLAFYDVREKRYLDIPVHEQCEALSVTGSIGRSEGGDWTVHIHAVVGLRDGSTRGGHLRHAVVRPTLEVVVSESARPLSRRLDPETGLHLLDLGADDQVVEHDPLRHGLAPPTGHR
ncbi:PCC domain-containing protein [Saccharothrix sp.]|uniref:PPC domain-containing DNA-binding protein n=1 Tax=Saccharothrix sp. TaxID=1873460 RepID=UPI0028122A93|nr:DUF296 domain-containing protein [Saccharothrix sp.]